MKKFKKILRRVLIIVPTIMLILFVLHKNGLLGNFLNMNNLKNKYLDLSNKTTSIFFEKISEISGKVYKPGPLKFKEFTGLEKGVYLSKTNVIAFTNKERLSNNIDVLKENKKLNLSAQKKLQDMFTNQYFEHDSLEGDGVEDVAQEVGYKNILIGENLALGNFKNEQELVTAWMNSKGHRANILNSKYTEIGVAVGKGLFKGKEVWIAVQHFGTPANVCPLVDESLYNEVTQNQLKIDQLEAEIKEAYDRLPIVAFGGGFLEGKALDEYNNKVTIFNYLLEETKTKTNIYNSQIKSFNECIVKYQ